MAAAATVNEMTFNTPSDVEIEMTRSFDAPRELVFAAYTQPEHLKQWMLGPDGWTMPTCDLDLRPGGKWHFVWEGAAGERMEMNGEYREIVAPEKIVQTESWGSDWADTIVTTTFTEESGRTKVVQRVLYPSKEARDRAAQTGMKEGAALSLQRLERVLAELR